jgi:N-acyl amino acid synthase of PEP-CTERM/exosortase system
MTEDMAATFNKFFSMVPATPPGLLEQVYKLRYQVYCLETGFENSEDFPDGQEKDEFDDRSEHYLIQHLETKDYAATTRLILPDNENPNRPFPLERHSRIDRPDILQPIARRRLAEVSRFCVSKDFKRRLGEVGTIAGFSGDHDQDHYFFKEEERRTFPLITLALIACLVRITVQHETTHWYSTMEPTLIRFLKHLGIHFTPIGPPTEYHGKRIPCIIEVQSLLDGVKAKNSQGWNLLTDYGRLSKI